MPNVQLDGHSTLGHPHLDLWKGCDCFPSGGTPEASAKWGEAVYSWQYIYGLWILVHAGTRLGQINPSGLPVTEMIPQVDCLSSSYSLCFFRDLLGDAKLLHPAVPPVSTSWQAFLFATLCSAHKESSSDPSRTTKLCFPPNNFVKDFLVGLKKKFIKHMN